MNLLDEEREPQLLAVLAIMALMCLALGVVLQ